MSKNRAPFIITPRAMALAAILALAVACAAQADASECDAPICFDDSLIITNAEDETSLDQDSREFPDGPIREFIERLKASLWKEEDYDAEWGQFQTTPWMDNPKGDGVILRVMKMLRKEQAKAMMTLHDEGARNMINQSIV